MRTSQRVRSTKYKRTRVLRGNLEQQRNTVLDTVGIADLVRMSRSDNPSPPKPSTPAHLESKFLSVHLNHSHNRRAKIMKLIAVLTAGLAIAGLSMSASAATFTDGYTIGSNLLGDTIVDGATASGLGTSDLRANDTGNGAGAYDWVATWEGLWNVGDEVSITGLALHLRSPNTGTSNNTSNGTFTFTFYELTAGGSGWDGTDNGETVLDTVDINFTIAGSGSGLVPYATFDTPLNFTATSTGIAIHMDSTGSIRTRWDDGADGVDGISESLATGNNGPQGHQWTIAGTVVPAPAALPAGLALLGFVAARRRR